jgi:predicted metal-dependent peptidase
VAWEQKLSIARLAAAQKMPYFRTALWALIPVASSDVATMAVNARAVMKVNPKFVEANTIERLAAALLHEVSHVLRDHGPRFCTVENLPLSVLHGGVTREIKAKSELWNLAGDACINEDLLLAGCDCGKDWVYAGNLKQPKGLTTEAYYEALKMQAKSPP